MIKRDYHSRVTLFISLIAGIAAAVVFLSLPLGYFMLSYQHEVTALETEAEINARIVTQLINANPDNWHNEELRLEELLRMRPDKGAKEIRRILDMSGTVIAESLEPLYTPLITRSDALYDAGMVVGRIDVIRSLRPLLVRTVIMTALGALVGLGGFFVLRVVPLRALRHALQSLSLEKERAQVTLRSIGDGVITTDAKGRVVLINPIAEGLTGWTLEEAAGRPLAEVFPIINEQTRKPCENPVEQVLKERAIVGLANHTALIARDGTERLIADSSAPIYDKDGALIGFVLVFRDITEKHKMEDAMQRADKLESVGILAGGIAHDFNNLLQAIMGNISLAKMLTNPKEKTCVLLEEAEKASEQAKELSYRLLTFSKGGEPVRRATSLEYLLKESIRLCLSGSNASCELTFPKDLDLVEVDRGQMNQVFNNLLINAIEAMPDGGIVEISAANIRVTGSDNLPLKEGNYVKVSVADHGTGIPAKYLPRIFDPYFSTKDRGSEKGMGLGLAICYSIVAKHEGYIAVESMMDVGTSFHVYLPATERKQEEGPVRESHSAPRKMRVLFMDDDERVRKITGAMLEQLSYEVEFAKNGEEAIERYQRAKEAGQTFAAAILDLTVQGGMGGEKAVRRLQEIDQEVRAVVSSGYADDPVMKNFGMYGFVDALAKPYSLETLKRLLARLQP